jgi:hypothetical protein
MSDKKLTPFWLDESPELEPSVQCALDAAMSELEMAWFFKTGNLPCLDFDANKKNKTFKTKYCS